jgi:hypothetical protein
MNYNQVYHNTWRVWHISVEKFIYFNLRFTMGVLNFELFGIQGILILNSNSTSKFSYNLCV